MPRLFSGIEIPRDIATRLGLMGAPLTGAKWIAPEDLHLTTYFAGDIDNDQADEWARRLALIEFAAFDITITGLGVFGKSRPRSVWAAIEPNDQLLALQKEHKRAAQGCGIAPETNPYKPHITLARFNGTSSQAVAGYLSAQGALRCAPFTARRAALFSARPGRGGGPYPVEETFPFIGAGEDALDKPDAQGS